MDRYRVVAPYVTVRSASFGGGIAVHGLHREALLPADVPVDEVERLARKGLVERVGEVASDGGS